MTELAQWLGLDYLFNPHKRLYWGYLLSSGLIVALYLACSRQPAVALFSRAVWWHPSARLDYAYFCVASVTKALLLLPWMLTAGEVTLWTLQALLAVDGYRKITVVDRHWLILFYTLALFMVSDFSRYWLHRLLHSIPWLWEFHKVHHSAEVLTPVTFYRVHPVENLLFGLRYALVAGLVTGTFIHYFGAGLGVLDVLGVNLLVFLFHLLGDNLRHSPVRLGYFDALERWLISPAQHQFHHTMEGSRLNYGGVLAVWDRLFGSLRLSRPDDRYRFGLPDGQNAHRTVTQLLLQPFLDIINPTGETTHEKSFPTRFDTAGMRTDHSAGAGDRTG